MKTAILYRTVSVAAFVLLLNACQKVLYVAPRKVDCAAGLKACYLVKSDLEENWILQRDPIVGLDYVEGYRYKVKAKRVRSPKEETVTGYHLSVSEVLEKTRVFENSQLLGSKTWRLTHFGPAGAASTPLEEADIQIEFNTEEKKINGTAGCNRFFGRYEVGEEALEFATVGTTKMACAPEVMAQESVFLDLLQGMRKYTIQESTLELSDQSGNVLIFERASDG